MTSRVFFICAGAEFLAGAHGVVDNRESGSAMTLLKAIGKVHRGETWIDRNATSCIFMEMARQKADRKKP